MFEKYKEIHFEMLRKLKETKKENQQLRVKYGKIKRKYEKYQVADKPTLFVRIFKPSMVKKYQASLLEYEAIKQEYEKMKQIIEQLQTDEQLNEEINRIGNIIDQSTHDAPAVIKYYIENNIPIILTEKDKSRCMKEIDESYDKDQIFKTERRMEKLEDVMLIHKTDFIPQKETIGTRLSSNVIDVTDVTIEGKKYNINLRPRRNSVHFAVNHEVSANGGGSWEKCKYAVIVPLLSIPKEKFDSNNCVDTFTNGEVKLTDQAYILCPKDEIDEVKKKNPNITVIGYEGDTAMDYANVLLWILGYTVERGNDWGFDDTERQISYHKMILESGYSSVQHHSKTKTKQIETKNFYVSFIIGVIELVKNNSELHNIDSQKIIEDSKIDSYLYYCDSDTSHLFNYYLAEIGLEPNYPQEGISSEHAMDYCKLLIEQAKDLNKNQSFKL